MSLPCLELKLSHLRGLGQTSPPRPPRLAVIRPLSFSLFYKTPKTDRPNRQPDGDILQYFSADDPSPIPRHQNASPKLAPSARHPVPKQHSAPPCCRTLAVLHSAIALSAVWLFSPPGPPRSSLRTFQPAFSGANGGCRIRDGPGPRGLGAGRSGGGQMVCFSLWLLVSVVGVRRCCGVSRRLTRPIFSPAPTTEKK